MSALNIMLVLVLILVFSMLCVAVWVYDTKIKIDEIYNDMTDIFKEFYKLKEDVQKSHDEIIREVLVTKHFSAQNDTKSARIDKNLCLLAKELKKIL